jgi:5'-deoxynucleotidase
MRNVIHENVQEHSHMVAVIAHALAVIRKDIYGMDVDPGKEAAIALFHDASEIFTGDLPTPVKYFDPDINNAYKRVESVASVKLLSALPKELRFSYEQILTPVNEDEFPIVKAADKLAAYIKCLEELKSGNQEFTLAAKQSRAKLDKLNMPEVD